MRVTSDVWPVWHWMQWGARVPNTYITSELETEANRWLTRSSAHSHHAMITDWLKSVNLSIFLFCLKDFQVLFQTALTCTEQTSFVLKEFYCSVKEYCFTRVTTASHANNSTIYNCTASMTMKCHGTSMIRWHLDTNSHDAGKQRIVKQLC